MPRYSVQVTWLDTGECFPTIAEAARHMPLSLPSLENARRGGKSEACGLKEAAILIELLKKAIA